MTSDLGPSIPPLIPYRGSSRSTFHTRRISLSPLPTYKIFFLAILFICIASFSAQAQKFKVIRVADGDTLTILQQGLKVRVRLVGIDALETSRSKRDPGQPYSQTSKKHLAGLVLTKKVFVKNYSQDRYKRILGEVFLGGTNVNLEMVAVGLADVSRGRAPMGLGTEKYWRTEDAQELSPEHLVPGGQVREPQAVAAKKVEFHVHLPRY
jgi:endonuclease YncB( thermonuclease family)